MVNRTNEIVELCKDHGCESIQGVKSIRSEYTEDKPQLNPELERKIEELWQQQVTAHREKHGTGEPLNNEFLYCKSHTVQENGVLQIRFRTTDWKHYSLVKVIPGAEPIWAIGTAAVMTFEERGEKYYVFATRDTNTVYTGGRIEAPPGGYLEPSLVRTGIQDLQFNPYDENTKKEFEEEIGLPRNRINSLRLVEAIRVRNDYSIDYAIEVDTNQRELVKALKKSRKYDGEHAGHYIVKESELLSFVRKNAKSLTPRTKSNIISLLTAPQII